MDNLTAQKKLKLISDCINAEDSVGKLHIDVRKMYAYFSDTKRYDIISVKGVKK